MKNSLLVLAIFTLWGCSSTSDSSSRADTSALEEVLTGQDANRKGAGENACLMAYQTKLDQLLTAAMVYQATAFTENTMDSTYRKIMGPAYHEVSYKFKNGRKSSIPGIPGEHVTLDFVTLGGVKAISLSEFERNYRALSAEEEATVQEAFTSAIENGTGNESVDKALEQLKGVTKETIKEAGNEMMSVFKQVSQGYRLEEGLGDAARWNIVSQRLVVLQKGVQFELAVDISSDTKKNRAVARTLAQQILNKCK